MSGVAKRGKNVEKPTPGIPNSLPGEKNSVKTRNCHAQLHKIPSLLLSQRFFPCFLLDFLDFIPRNGDKDLFPRVFPPANIPGTFNFGINP